MLVLQCVVGDNIAAETVPRQDEVCQLMWRIPIGRVGAGILLSCLGMCVSRAGRTQTGIPLSTLMFVILLRIIEVADHVFHARPPFLKVLHKVLIDLLRREVLSVKVVWPGARSHSYDVKHDYVEVGGELFQNREEEPTGEPVPVSQNECFFLLKEALGSLLELGLKLFLTDLWLRLVIMMLQIVLLPF